MSALVHKTVSYALIAFIAGFAVLSVEITGARLISGTLGNSIYTWSALIAAVLLSMSIGSIVGGLLIDRSLHVTWLLGALLFAAITTSVAPMIAAAVNSGVASMPLIEAALIGCALIFALPSFAYGAIPPLCVKLLSAGDKGKNVGFSAGIISMAGSFGSFAGALVTPFWLIPHLSLTSIFYCLAGLVVLSCLLLIRIAPFSRRTAVLVVAGSGALLLAGVATRITAVQPPYIYDHNTPYNRIRVMERPNQGKRTRILFLDTTVEGGIVTGSESLPVEYQNTWKLVQELGIPVKRALCIGAGAFGVPERLSQAYPSAIIDVVEIDPKVIAVGFNFFDLARFQNIVPIAEDGRLFLNRTSENYDLIFIDAYHGIRYIPPHLATLEFFRLCERHLSRQGIVMINVISAITGPRSELFQSFGATVKAVFEFCYAIPLRPSLAGSVQNIVLVCSSASLAEPKQIQLRALSSFGLPDRDIMVDEKNPIEAILARQLSEGG
jgi:spermidine synthase